jgi:enoyl-CoA hydratase/carnithine racemase
VADLITIEDRDGCTLIGLNDPARHNAISIELIEQLHAVIASPEGSDPKSFVFWGHGKSFSSGANMDEYLASLEAVRGNDARRFYDSERLLIEIVRVLRRPNVVSVAAVHGWVAGIGVELSTACDFIVADPGATFWLPETSVGWNSGMGLTQRLVRTVGLGWARRLMLLGEQLDASKAEQVGLVARLYPHAELLVGAIKLVKEFRSKAPLAAQYQKRLLELLPAMGLEDSMEIEIITGHWLAHTHDVREAARAFVEKRSASFRGE